MTLLYLRTLVTDNTRDRLREEARLLGYRNVEEYAKHLLEAHAASLPVRRDAIPRAPKRSTREQFASLVRQLSAAGWTAEQIAARYPNHTTEQVAALQAELEAAALTRVATAAIAIQPPAVGDQSRHARA